MRDYHKLEVWKRAHLLTLRVYRFTTRFPSDERFGLVTQMRRAAASAPLNIAEGAGRPTAGDYARFLGIAAASLQELLSQLELSRDLDFGRANEGDEIRKETAELKAMITVLRARIEKDHHD
ncbi:MAG: four helix bundle protein [Actinomycetota bacterium]